MSGQFSEELNRNIENALLFNVNFDTTFKNLQNLDEYGFFKQNGFIDKHEARKVKNSIENLDKYGFIDKYEARKIKNRIKNIASQSNQSNKSNQWTRYSQFENLNKYGSIKKDNRKKHKKFDSQSTRSSLSSQSGKHQLDYFDLSSDRSDKRTKRSKRTNRYDKNTKSVKSTSIGDEEYKPRQQKRQKHKKASQSDMVSVPDLNSIVKRHFDHGHKNLENRLAEMGKENRKLKNALAKRSKESRLSTYYNPKDFDLRYENQPLTKINDEKKLSEALETLIPNKLERRKEERRFNFVNDEITYWIENDENKAPLDNILNQFNDMSAAAQSDIICSLGNLKTSSSDEKKTKDFFLQHLHQIHKMGFRKLISFFINFMIVYFLTFQLSVMLGTERNVNPSLMSLPSIINPRARVTTTVVRDYEFASNVKSLLFKMGHIETKVTKNNVITQKVQDFFQLPDTNLEECSDYYRSPLFFQILIKETKESLKDNRNINYINLKEIAQHYDKLEANTLGLAEKFLSVFVSNKADLNNFLEKHNYNEDFEIQTQEQRNELISIFDNIIKNLEEIVKNNDKILPELQKHLDILVRASVYKSKLDSLMNEKTKEDIKEKLENIYRTDDRFLLRNIENRKFEEIERALEKEKITVFNIQAIINHLETTESDSIRTSYDYVYKHIGNVLNMETVKSGLRGNIFPSIMKYEDGFTKAIKEVEELLFKRERLEQFRRKFRDRYYFANVFNTIVTLLAAILLNKRKKFADSIYYITQYFSCSETVAIYIYRTIFILSIFVLLMANAENYTFVHQMFDLLKNIALVWIGGNMTGAFSFFG